MFGPPGSLSETALGRAGGGIPASWGVFPRCMIALLRMLGVTSLHASAVEVYQDRAFDLLQDRKPLKIGKTKNSHRTTTVGKQKLIGKNSGGIGNPTRDEWLAKKKAQADFKARLEKKRAEDLQAKLSRGRRRGKERVSLLPQRSSRKSLPKISGARRAGTKAASSSEAAGTARFATVGETLALLQTAADVARLARLIEATRVAHGHALNARSSRSHCLVHVHVLSTDAGRILQQQMLFVDLAGSERIEKSGVEGMMRSEALGINSSLTHLGRVIKQLGAGADHVSFRDCVLTMLLKSSFGGRSATSVVVNIASDERHTPESISSLRFGQRMTRVRNNATLGAGRDVGEAAAEVRAALDGARAELDALRAAGAGERFGAAATFASIKTFNHNRKKLAATKQKLIRARQHLVEARATRGGTTDRLELAVKQLEVQGANFKDVILRERNIKHFFHPATPGFASKAAEVKALEARCEMMRDGGGMQ